MSREPMPVDPLLSYACRDGGGVVVSLRLPDAPLTQGPIPMRLRRRQGELRLTGDVVSEAGAAGLTFRLPTVTPGRRPWRIAVQPSADARFEPLEARLLARRGQPVAILPGPAPTTRMRPPAPRHQGRARTPARPLVSPSRRALRRGRALARSVRGVARRTARRVTAGGKDQPADRAPDRPNRSVRPAVRLGPPTLKAVRAAGHGPTVVLTDRWTDPTVAAWLAGPPAGGVAARRIMVGEGPSRVEASGPSLVSDLDDLEARLHQLGPLAALLVALSPESLGALGADHLQLADRLFPHVRRGGSYVAHAVRAGDAAAVPSRDGGFATFQTALRQGAGRRGRVLDPASGRRVRGVGKSVIHPSVVVLRKNRIHCLRLGEGQVATLLPLRDPGVEMSVLASRPGGTLAAAMTEFSYGPRVVDAWPDSVDYPGQVLRHYSGDVTSLGSMRLVTDSSVLPESFRWPNAERPTNPQFRGAGAGFSEIPRVADVPLLDGDYYFLDCLFSGHFGHLLTEVVCRLWGWEEARQQLPGLKVVFHTDPRRSRDGSLERRLFAAYGIPEADLVAVEGPARLRSVVGASPMWHGTAPPYAHPDIRETWARLTSGLLGGRPPEQHERIFVSRGEHLGRRRCSNQADVERFFADRGFHVLYPERLPLDEQVALFAGARVVAGFAGSAMFNLMHCRHLERTIVISHNSYGARNEELFASILGGELHYFWQEADAPPLEGDAPLSEREAARLARRSSFAFDFDAFGADLARVATE